MPCLEVLEPQLTATINDITRMQNLIAEKQAQGADTSVMPANPQCNTCASWENYLNGLPQRSELLTSLGASIMPATLVNYGRRLSQEPAEREMAAPPTLHAVEGRKLQIEEPCSNECDYPNDEVCDDEVCDVGELVGKLVDGTADWSSYGALVVAITGLFALLAVGPPVVTLMKRKRQQQLANAERRRRAVVLQQQRAVQAARAAQSNAARRLTVQTKIDTLTRERDVLKGRIAWLQVQMEDESTMDESAPILRIAEENLKGVEQSLARAKAELAAIPP